MMKTLVMCTGLLCLILCVGLRSEEASGPPAPVPYRKIADPADDAERHIVVKAGDRGPVWLLTGFLSGWEPGIEFEHLARVKPKHMRMGVWPFWYPVSITQRRQKTWGDYRESPVELGKYLDTMLRLRETGLKWQLNLHFKGHYDGWLSFVNSANEEQLKDYYDHIYTLVKYCRDMGLPVDYWEVTNEPAHPYNTEENPGGYFKHSWQDLLAFWDTNYDAIRAAYPEAKIVGPSFGGAGDGDMVTSVDAFLAHCKEKGQKLDVLSWHINCCYRGPNGSYWDEVDGVHREIENVRKLVETKYPMVGVEAYHIDEWGYYLPQTGLGAQVAYFYYMDLAGLDRAAKTGPPYMMSATRISPDTPRAAYWAWAEYAKQDGGLRLVTETNDRCFVALASRDDEGVVRALVGRAKRQSIADPPEAAPDWKWGDQAPAKPGVDATIEFEGVPLSGQAEVTIWSLPSGTGPLYEDELEALTTTVMMDVADGKLTIELADVVEDNAFSIVIGPAGTREKDRESDSQWAKAKPEKGGELSERELHRRAMEKAEQAAKAGTIRIACGSAFAYTDPKGNSWFADREYVEGSFGYSGGGTAHRGPILIEGTDNPEVYRSELWGLRSYHITLPKGNYRLRLHWAETYGLGAGGRTFDVVVEGKTVLKDFDATREAGGTKRAVVREIEVEVTDGVLDFTFPRKENVTPMINGIEVIRRP